MVAIDSDGVIGYFGRNQDVESAYECYPPPSGSYKSVETAGVGGACGNSSNSYRLCSGQSVR